MKKLAGWSLVIALIMLLLAACQERDQGETVSGTNLTQAAGVTPAKKNIDPCSYLTAEEIEKTLGWKVATREAKPYGDTGTCTYASATPYTASGLQQVTVIIGQGMPDMSSSEKMAAWRWVQVEKDESMKSMNPIVKPVDGLGVPAIQNGFEDMFAIEMAVDGKLVTVSLFDAMEPATAIARSVLAHMK